MAFNKLVKVDREIAVTICDNGFMLAVNGRTEGDDWSNSKVICESISDLMTNIENVALAPLND